MLRWTAPAAGSAAVSGTALLYDSSGLGSFTVNYNSSTAKFGPDYLTYGLSYPYSFTQAVAARGMIDFCRGWIICLHEPTTHNSTP